MTRPFSDACITHWLILEDIKLLLLFCLLSGLHLSFSAYKRRKARESKQGSKNSIVEIEATLRIQRRIEKTTATFILIFQETEFYPRPAQQKYLASVVGSAVAYKYPSSSEPPYERTFKKEAQPSHTASPRAAGPRAGEGWGRLELLCVHAIWTGAWAYDHPKRRRTGLVLHTDNLFHLMTPGWTQIKYKNIHWIFTLDLLTFLPQL